MLFSCHWLTPLGRSLDVILRHVPLGAAWLAFRLPGKRAFRLMQGIAGMFEDGWAALCALAAELNPYTTEQMITEWETAVSLPDACLWAAKTLEERRAQLVYRLSKRRWTTAQDWTDLGALFGLHVRTTPGWLVQKTQLEAGPAYIFPRLGRFRVYLDIIGITISAGYDYGGSPPRGPGYPIPYGMPGFEIFNNFQCLIDRIKPANVVVIWNANPLFTCYAETFAAEFSDEFCGTVLEAGDVLPGST